MEIIKIRPQGFCKGVINAIKSLNANFDKAKRPIYMYGSLVHNEHVISAYKDLGIIQIDDLDKVSEGTIIITAHGLSNYKRNIILSKNIDIIDTTCVEVKKIQNIIFEKEKDKYDIIYFGNSNHPECKAILEDHKNIHLIQSINDIYKLDINNDKILFASQTTASYLDVKLIEDLLIKKYTNIEIITDICTATKQRQNALIEASSKCDMVLIIGDIHSNNTNKLKEIASKYTKSYLIEDINDLKGIDFNNVDTLGITAGASTPNILVDEIIKKIKDDNYISNIKNEDYIKI